MRPTATQPPNGSGHARERLPDDRPCGQRGSYRSTQCRQRSSVFHHVLADGIGGLAVLAGLVDGAEETPEREFPRPAPATSRLALDALRSRVRGLSRLPRAPARVGAAVKELRATGGTQAARCSLNRPTGPDRRLAVATVELAAVVDVAHDYGGSVNDVVLSAIDGALLTLLAGRGEQVQRLVVSIPVSRRQATTAAELGNQVGVAPMELPALTDRVERLRVIVARRALIRSAPRRASADLLLPLFDGLARLGAFRWFVNRQRLVNSFVTNLRGPEDLLCFVGSPVTAIFPIGAISGNVSVAFAVLSYAGTLTVTVVADPDAVPEVGVLCTALQQELDAYAYA
jgi:diacylglycerol O-acyltransferase